MVWYGYPCRIKITKKTLRPLRLCALCVYNSGIHFAGNLRAVVLTDNEKSIMKTVNIATIPLRTSLLILLTLPEQIHHGT